jgi:hypothetical protein
MNVIMNWKTIDRDCVSFVSFSTFQSLLTSFVSPAAQFWAIWTLHHFCSENRKWINQNNFNKFIYEKFLLFLTAEKYCALLLKEIGIDSLKALQQNSQTNQYEPSITLYQKILEIFEN